MWRRTLTVLGACLVLFHAWLLGSQAWGGQLADPSLVLRWATAAGLVVALVGLHRRGESMVRGRKAVCIWLLAALLHAPTMTGAHVGDESPALPEAVTAAVQIAAASLLAGLGLALLAAIALDLRSRPRAGCLLAVASIPGTCRGRRTLPYTPRPPPLRFQSR